MELVIVRVAFKVVDGLLPVRRKNIFVLSVKSLVNIRPWSCVQFGRGIALCRQLKRCAEVSDGLFLLNIGFAGGQRTAALAPVMCRNVSIGSGA